MSFHNFQSDEELAIMHGVKPGAPMSTTQAKVKNLECCCCGETTRGRQWWNRDTGYGICSKCIAWMRSRGTSEAEIADLYGKEGEHFTIDEHADLRQNLAEALDA